jgi:hypothetical protein
MYIIDYKSKTVTEFNELELSNLLNNTLGKYLDKTWLFAHNKEKVIELLEFALNMKDKNVQ